MRELGDPRVRLMVVGGREGLVAEYRRRVRDMGLEERVSFAGMQSDLRPYYWAADAFIFPSCYETFSLVAFEAAAAGLPIVATRVNGVEEMLHNLENGLLLDRTVASISQGIQHWLSLAEPERRSMGRQARITAERYSIDNFVAAWRSFYELLA